MKRERTQETGFLQRMQWIGMLFLTLILVFFYVPEIKTQHAKLPELTEWEKVEGNAVKTTLPKAFQNVQEICFWSNHQQLEVYLEGRIINESDTKEETFSRVPASCWNRIEIPEDSDGKELRICSKSGETPEVTEYVYGSNTQINQWLHQRFGMIQLLDVGMIGLGICFVLFALFHARKTRSRELPLYFGQVLIQVGMFFRVSLKGMPIYHMSEVAREITAYFTFFTMTIPFLIYVRKKIRIGELFEGICQIITSIQIATVSVGFLLHHLNIIDISGYAWVGVLFWNLCILLLFVGEIINLRRRKNMGTVLSFVSSLILFLIIPLEILRTTVGLPYVKEYGTILRSSILIVAVLEILVYSLNIRELEVQKGKMEEENKRLQLQLLASQIRPHFVLNTLGAIRSMVMQDAQRASDLLYDFSKYLRKNIEEKDYMKKIPFMEELDYIETYLRLEQTRFGERLRVDYEIEKKDFRVLPLTIQPFVENAVKHGLFPKKNGGTIQIKTYENDHKIFLEIKDDGVGFDAENLNQIIKEKKSVGLKSAIYRIEDMRGKCNIISQKEQGTFVRIILPK